jgi:hypothetical protein
MVYMCVLALVHEQGGRANACMHVCMHARRRVHDACMHARCRVHDACMYARRRVHDVPTLVVIPPRARRLLQGWRFCTTAT